MLYTIRSEVACRLCDINRPSESAQWPILAILFVQKPQEAKRPNTKLQKNQKIEPIIQDCHMKSLTTANVKRLTTEDGSFPHI